MRGFAINIDKDVPGKIARKDKNIQNSSHLEKEDALKINDVG